MVASPSKTYLPTLPVPGLQVRQLGYGPVKFTVALTTEMVEQGLLPEDSTIELIDGSLVYRDRFDLNGNEIVEGSGHNFVVAGLAELAARINNVERHLRTQSTLICSETSAPIPDGVVLKGVLSDYRGKRPTAADSYCVIEVADSSYERDRGDKLFGYALAGVRQYIIINLRNRTAEIYFNADTVNGTYPPAVVIGEHESLPIRIGESEHFAVLLEKLLP